MESASDLNKLIGCREAEEDRKFGKEPFRGNSAYQFLVGCFKSFMAYDFELIDEIQ